MKQTSLQDIVVMPQGERAQHALKMEFMERVFFLPKEVLADKNWNIEPMRVITAGEWFSNVNVPQEAGAYIHYEPGEYLCRHAKQLGVSVRKHWLTGECFIVVKLWYGKN